MTSSSQAEAEDEWSAHTAEIHEQTLMAQGDKVNSWMMGANLEKESRAYWSTLVARISTTTSCGSQRMAPRSCSAERRVRQSAWPLYSAASAFT